ncbi:Non-specific serine/threonine protein kinase [Ascochyta rabiei]|uniref:Non-specific serine/threonine protein kinase n=1 Tax=Didymella rabiei TaxID=5454 RepID=UPI0022048DD3|nr:Non-specific serine/threonine protein kinase [Ascochyta rabiei]UPX12609.1 Non-specific serine/threonine protein kinase [Ascochyta rabiei]
MHVSRYSWHDDLTISREHLRIHCILYEQDPISDIAPFVYATDLSTNGTHMKKSNAECTGSQGRGVLMGKNGTFLLDDGDELQLSETVTLIYHSFGTVRKSVLTQTQERERAILSSRYLVTGRLLGEGGYGKVLIGIDQKTQRQLACKIINLEKLYNRRTMAHLYMPTSEEQTGSSQAINQLPDNVHSCFREFDILKDLSHPNIVHIQKVFWSQSTIYMFQELVTGGDLFSYIEYKHGRISSIESAVIIRQILKGVQYLHDQDIVHRDLKPDNILMTSLDSGARVVITDFGNARFLPNLKTQDDSRSNKLKRMFSLVGTLEYTAPEIHKANHAIPSHYGYSLSVDMWSIGSITAAILTGEQIFGCRQNDSFEEDPRRVIIKLAAQCDLSILDDEFHPLWGPIAQAPKDFIKRLLVLEEEDRMSASEALDHIWFTHPYMAAEFDAQYERSTRDWTPRHKDDQLIEQISFFLNRVVSGSRSRPGGVTVSRFFGPKLTPTQITVPDQYQHMEEQQPDAQLASQLAPLSYNNAYTNNEGHNYSQANRDLAFDERYDVALDWNPVKQQTYVESSIGNPPIPHSKGQVRPNKPAAGQLQRVSTSTRGKYFEREIVDLDDLGAPSDEFNEAMGTAQLDHNINAASHGRLRRENTVQVRTTPSADDEGLYDVNRWWHDRYPQTLFYYDTQAEPVTQDENSVVVQETPPEVFAKPSQPRVRHVAIDGCSFDRHHDYSLADEAPSAHETSKRRRVYGRQL